jgi:hypothetical protein
MTSTGLTGPTMSPFQKSVNSVARHARAGQHPHHLAWMVALVVCLAVPNRHLAPGGSVTGGRPHAGRGDYIRIGGGQDQRHRANLSGQHVNPNGTTWSEPVVHVTSAADSGLGRSGWFRR